MPETEHPRDPSQERLSGFFFDNVGKDSLLIAMLRCLALQWETFHVNRGEGAWFRLVT